MKQYLAFFGETYYPNGGMSDLINDFDTVQQAIQAITDTHKKHDIHNHGWDGHVWCHIYDTHTRTFIYGCPIEYINPEDGNMWEDEPRMLREGEQLRT
jgi:hypothetical protein